MEDVVEVQRRALAKWINQQLERPVAPVLVPTAVQLQKPTSSPRGTAAHAKARNPTASPELRQRVAEATAVLPPPVKSLTEDLKDGRVLLRLLGVLSAGDPDVPVIAGKTADAASNLREQLLSVPPPSEHRIHHIANVSRALRFLRLAWRLPLENITVEEVVAGHERQTLRLVWKIAMRSAALECSELAMEDDGALRRLNAVDTRTMAFRSKLLEWCQQTIQSFVVSSSADEDKAIIPAVTDFSTAWQSGILFHQLLRVLVPVLAQRQTLPRLLDEAQDRAEWPSICDRAFDLALEHLGIVPLMFGNDLGGKDARIDEKSVMLYVAQFALFAKRQSVHDENGAVRRVESLLDVYRSSLDDFVQHAEEIAVRVDLSSTNKIHALNEAEERSIIADIQTTFQKMDLTLAAHRTSINEQLTALVHYAQTTTGKSHLVESAVKLARATHELSLRSDRLRATLQQKGKSARRLMHLKLAHQSVQKRLLQVDANLKRLAEGHGDIGMADECELELRILGDAVRQKFGDESELGLAAMAGHLEKVSAAQLDKVKHAFTGMRKSAPAKAPKAGMASVLEADAGTFQEWIAEKLNQLRDKTLPDDCIQMLAAPGEPAFLAELSDFYAGFRQEMASAEHQLKRLRDQCLRLLGGSSKERDSVRHSVTDATAEMKETDKLWEQLQKLVETRTTAVLRAKEIRTFFGESTLLLDSLAQLADDVIVVPTETAESEEAAAFTEFIRRRTDLHQRVDALAERHRETIVAHSTLDNRMNILRQQVEDITQFSKHAQIRVREHRMLSAYYEHVQRYVLDIKGLIAQIDNEPVPDEDRVYKNRPLLDVLQIACINFRGQFETLYNDKYEDFNERYRALKDASIEEVISRDSALTLLNAKNQVDLLLRQASTRVNEFVDVADSYERLYQIYTDGTKLRDSFAVVLLDLRTQPDEDPRTSAKLDALEERYQAKLTALKDWNDSNHILIETKKPLHALADIIREGAEECVALTATKRRNRTIFESYDIKSQQLVALEPAIEPLLARVEQLTLPHFEKLDELNAQYDVLICEVEEITAVLSKQTMLFMPIVENTDDICVLRPGFGKRLAKFEEGLEKIRQGLFTQRASLNRQRAYLETRIQIEEAYGNLCRIERTLVVFDDWNADAEMVMGNDVTLLQKRTADFSQHKQTFEDAQEPLSVIKLKLDRLCLGKGSSIRASSMVVLAEAEQAELQSRFAQVVERMKKIDSAAAKNEAHLALLRDQREYLFDGVDLAAKLDLFAAELDAISFPCAEEERIFSTFDSKMQTWRELIGKRELQLERLHSISSEPTQFKVVSAIDERTRQVEASRNKAESVLANKRSIMEVHLAGMMLDQKVAEMQLDFDEAIRNIRMLATDGSDEAEALINVTREDIACVQTLVNDLALQFPKLSVEEFGIKLRPLRNKIDCMRQVHAAKEHVLKYRQFHARADSWLNQQSAEPLPVVPSEQLLCDNKDAKSVLDKCAAEFKVILLRIAEFEGAALNDLTREYDAATSSKELDTETVAWVETAHRAIMTSWQRWSGTVRQQHAALDLLTNLNPEFSRGKAFEKELLAKMSAFSYDELLRIMDTKVVVNDAYLHQYASEVEATVAAASTWIARTHGMTAQSTNLGPLIVSISQAIDGMREQIKQARRWVELQAEVDAITRLAVSIDDKYRSYALALLCGQAYATFSAEVQELAKRVDKWFESVGKAVPACHSIERDMVDLKSLKERLAAVRRVGDKLHSVQALRLSWNEQLADGEAMEGLEQDSLTNEVDLFVAELGDWLNGGKFVSPAEGSNVGAVSYLQPAGYAEFVQQTVDNLRKTIELAVLTKDEYYMKHEELLQRIAKHTNSVESKIVGTHVVTDIDGFLEHAEKKSLDLISAQSQWEAMWTKPFQQANVEPFPVLTVSNAAIKKSIGAYQTLIEEGKKLKAMYTTALEFTAELAKAGQVFEQTGYQETDKAAFDVKLAVLTTALSTFEAKREQWGSSCRLSSKIAHKSTLVKRADEKLFKPVRDKATAIQHASSDVKKAFEDMSELQRTLTSRILVFKEQLEVSADKRGSNGGTSSASSDNLASSFSEQYQDYQSEFAKWKVQTERGKISYQIFGAIHERSKDLCAQAEAIIGEAMNRAGTKQRIAQCTSTIERLERDIEEVALKFQEINPTLTVAHAVNSMDIQSSDGTFKSRVSLDDSSSSEETVGIKSKLGSVKNVLDASDATLRDIGVHVQHLEDTLQGLKIFEQDVLATESSLQERRVALQQRSDDLRATYERKMRELRQQRDIQTLMNDIMEFRRRVQTILQQCGSVDGSTANLSTASSSSSPQKVRGSEVNLSDAFGQKLSTFESELSNLTPIYDELCARGRALFVETSEAVNKSMQDISKPASFTQNSIATNARKNVITFLDILQKSMHDAHRYNVRKAVRVFMSEAVQVEAWMEEKDRALRDLISDYKSLEKDRASEAELGAINTRLRELQEEIGSNADVEMLLEHAQTTAERVVAKQSLSFPEIEAFGSGRPRDTTGTELNQVNSMQESISAQWQMVRNRLTEATTMLAGAQELQIVEQRIVSLDESLAVVMNSLERIDFFFSRAAVQGGAAAQKERLDAEAWSLEQAKVARVKFEETLQAFIRNFAGTIKRNAVNAARVEALRLKAETLAGLVAQKEQEKEQRSAAQRFYSELALFETSLEAIDGERNQIRPKLIHAAGADLEKLRARMMQLQDAVVGKENQLPNLRSTSEILFAQVNATVGVELRSAMLGATQKWRHLHDALRVDLSELQNVDRYEQFKHDASDIATALEGLRQKVDGIVALGDVTVESVQSAVKSTSSFNYADFKYSALLISERYRKLTRQLKELHFYGGSEMKKLAQRVVVDVDHPADALGVTHMDMLQMKQDMWERLDSVRLRILSGDDEIRKRETLCQFATEIEHALSWHEHQLSRLPGTTTERFDASDAANADREGLVADAELQEACAFERMYVSSFVRRVAAKQATIAAMSATFPVAEHYLLELKRLLSMDVELAAKLDQSKKLTMTHQRVCEFIEVEVQMEEALDQLERTAEVVRRGDDLRRSAFEQALTAAGALIEAVAQLNEDGMLDDFVRTHRADGLHLGGDALSVSDTDIADDGGLAVTLFSRRVNQVVATIREYDSSKRRASRLSAENSMQSDIASATQDVDEDPGVRELVDGFRSLIAEVHAEVQRELDTLSAIRQALPMDLLDENLLRQINQDALLDRLHVMDFGRFLAEHKERAEHMRLTKDAFKEKIQLLRDQHQSMLVDHEDSRSLKQANDELFRALSGLQLVFKSFQTETVEFRHIIMMLSVRHNSNAHKLKNKLNGSPATSASSSPKSRGERKDSATQPASGAWVRKLKEGTLAQKDNKRTDGESPPPLANAALRKPSNAIDDCREREIVVKFGDNQGATVG